MQRRPVLEETLLALRLHARHHDEATLTALAADGDPSAQAWLVERWTPPVYRFSLRMLGDEQDARDAAQETLVKVLRSLGRYDWGRSFATWVFGIARNTCIDEHRRRRRRGAEPPGDVPDDRPSPLHEVARRASADRVQEALGEIPPMYREVLIMFHFEHLKYTEIAEALDVPLGTVMNRIFRARRKLKDVLGVAGEDL